MNSDLKKFVYKKNYNDYFLNFGYRAFGPILFSFCKWLKKECSTNNIDKIYFLARDGYILKKAFNIIDKEHEFKTFYFYASRRSIIVPSLHKIKKPIEIFSAITFEKEIKMKSIIKKVGLEDYDLTEYLNKYKFDYDSVIKKKEIYNNAELEKFLEEIYPIIEHNSKLEYVSFLRYKKKNEFFGKVAIVDIGWFGSMQRALNVIADDTDMYGYYLGLYPYGNFYDNNKSKGFMFDKDHDIKNYEYIKNCLTIFEFMTLAQHGSVKRFNDSEENVEFYKYEYENSIDKEKVQNIQIGGLNFVKDYLIQNKEISINEALQEFLKHTLTPTCKDAKELGNIQFFDNDFQYIAKPNRSIIQIKNFLAEYKKSSWKIGFMKRTLKIKLPYMQITDFLRKRYSNE